ncbi:MAG: ATP-binding protein [Deltaproteobacteria bacterium]|nr:ATP-binding protein [Deltaproteobacteria bacterium]
MKRHLYQYLLNWKASDQRKPLLLKGARQVGKTYLLTAFGQKEFPHYHHFDFTKDKKLGAVFADSLDPLEIIRRLEIKYDLKIDADRDLIILDEIQECPRAITALKYFCDDFNNSTVIGSGSFLGLTLSPDAYPVGKVKTVTLYPMSFFEFLEGLEKTNLLGEIIRGIPKSNISKTVHEKAWEYLKYFLITGGLPEIVQTFKDHADSLPQALHKVRELQSEILDNYTSDIAKHCGKTNAIKINAVFNNVPLQLARENKTSQKFMFKDVLPTRSNYEHLEDPIEWLIKAGLIYKTPICKRAESPLKAYTDHNKFKLFLFDVGLLGAMVGLEPKHILDYDYGGYKGYFAENYVVGELASALHPSLFSWQEGTSEIEFLVEIGGQIIPIEVKAGINKKAKSLRVFLERYHPRHSFLISGNPVELKKTGLSCLPHYATALLDRLV